MRFGIMLITITAFSILSACAPIGFMDHDTVYDEMWIVPKRQTYNVGDDFRQTDDLLVFASYQGMVETIDIRRVSISLYPRPNGTSNGNGVIHITNGSYVLSPTVVGSGRKLIVVNFKNMIADYSIQVNDPFGLAPDPDDDGNIGGGIGIIWKD